MQNITVDRKKTLADYGFIPTTTTTLKPAKVEVKPGNQLCRVSVADWWTNFPDNQNIPIIIHVLNQSDIYAVIVAETAKALRLHIPVPNSAAIEKWVPKKAVLWITEA
jgi:hypothetical protein